jgi:hypothetical protein
MKARYKKFVSIIMNRKQKELNVGLKWKINQKLGKNEEIVRQELIRKKRKYNNNKIENKL